MTENVSIDMQQIYPRARAAVVALEGLRGEELAAALVAEILPQMSEQFGKHLEGANDVR